MIICPAIVPTTELEMPEAINEIEKDDGREIAQQRRQRSVRRRDVGDGGVTS